MDKSELVHGNTMTKNTEPEKSSPKTSSTELNPTLELKKHGYLAMTKGTCDSPPGYNGPQLSREASGLFELLSREQVSPAAAQGSEEIRGFRQSSIDSEPQTLSLFSVREAQDGAVEIVETYDQEEAVHLFLKDAEDDNLREEALAAILPTSLPTTESGTVYRLFSKH